MDSLRELMGDRAWNGDSTERLHDEHPSSDKDIGQVMTDQTDLVTIQHILSPDFNYKGV